jgi:iron complex outermembrane receptor protein
MGWDNGPLEITGTVNYISGISTIDPSYGVTSCAIALASTFPSGTPPSQFCRVPSFTELNVTARYKVNHALQLHAGVTNLLNRRAPPDLQTFGAAGGGGQLGGASYSPAFAQDGAIGPMFTLGLVYDF